MSKLKIVTLKTMSKSKLLEVLEVLDVLEVLEDERLLRNLVEH